ncbi:MAG: hypothetical protein PHH37_12065 [Paludibacter sp.]|nr:hypothetical protein [Paludibacter sp.]
MSNLFLGNNPVKTEEKKVSGRFVEIDGEKFYEIVNYDFMQPFFISLASDSDLWMYISSTGGLTAGRKNPDTALFPYYTDDKITDSAETTGSKTVFHITKNGITYLWEPFSDRNKGIYKIERSIAKSTIGNKLVFTEKNFDLGLTFSYSWMNADSFGWIKKSTLTNHENSPVTVYLVDGLQNLLPAGIDRLTQNTFSTLVDGYKKTELIPASGLALFRMESILVDRAEPSESLRANTVWSCGIDNPDIFLSSKQLGSIRLGERAIPETEAKGVRGAYFVAKDLHLEPNSVKKWYFIAELAQDVVAVNNLSDFILTKDRLTEQLEQSVEKGSKALKQIVSKADGIQETADEADMARHFANVLFNTMRGGIYSEGYWIESASFSKHVRHFNQKCFENHKIFLVALPYKIGYIELGKLIEKQNDEQLNRLYLEYLPLTFSRRHGDPSRPWNLFDINIKDENGNKRLAYQGNWRDIFQNWEALSLSYPVYISGIIAKFLNATTADGYNPYKVTNDGIEWEVIEPENPWSNIGYWGDHQIIYLLKLMELSDHYFPEKLQSWVNREMFAFANVPYRLKNYAEIVADPKNSIRFDAELHTKIEKLIPQYGADAKLMLNVNGEVVLATFTEKLLTTLLAKFSNFIPEAGIWMNTLRPEWNDANNALVGTGASMVTLYYIRRFIVFVTQLYAAKSVPEFLIVSDEIFSFFESVFSILIDYDHYLDKRFDDRARRKLTDELGKAGENFRARVYSGFSGQKHSLATIDLLNFLNLALSYTDHSIEINKREDGMYHAYNLVKFTDDGIEVRFLYEMLEGQVAVLSSGKLHGQEAVALLDAMRKSALYRQDQNSYMLYPDKKLPALIDKNNIELTDILQNQLLKALADAGDRRIVTVDNRGQYHFNASFHNADFLREALLKIRTEAKFDVRDDDITHVESIYEKIFDHQSFTGRSGTFYKYEGLGCIYWHMVSKLLLAIGENIRWTIDRKETVEIVESLKKHYMNVKSGIGAHKSPDVYGSFPFDPYSHTPTMAGVQQPGMTGQVKEDILSRFYELGIIVDKGCIKIRPDLLQRNEFIVDRGSNKKLLFSYCGATFIYEIGSETELQVHFNNGEMLCRPELRLSEQESLLVFNRSNRIKNITVIFKKGIF